MLQVIGFGHCDYIFQIPKSIHQRIKYSTMRTANRIGGLVVKLAVAKPTIRLRLESSVSASPGFDSRPMHFASCEERRWCCRVWIFAGECGGI